MFSLLVTIAPNALGFLVPVLTVQGVSLFRSDQELMGMRILVVMEASTTIDFALWVVGITEDKLIEGSIKGSHVPPKDTAISGDREEIVTLAGLSGPCHIIDGVVMRLFKYRGLHWLNDTLDGTNSQIEARDRTVVSSTSKNILDLVMTLHATQG